MKKTITLLLILVICVGAFGVIAAASGSAATLTGPSTVRAGDTITLTFKVSGSGIYGFSGALSYDKSVLEMKGEPTSKVSSPWMVEFAGDAFVAYDNNLSKPINSNTTIFTVKFKVKDNVAVGTKITVSCTGLTTSDGKSDTKIADATYAVTIAPPMSSDNNLKGITVEGATLAPAFSADVTAYTVTVPFEISKLELKATAKDSKATVSVDSPALKPGGTTDVTITVTAENGAKKVYTITVTREQDPNYVPSANNELASIVVDGFLLSPIFSSEVLDYVIWLPYETESVVVSGVPVDELASVQVVGGENLLPGEDNVIQVICIAENGEQREYTVIAKRAAAHGNEPTVPAPTDPSTPVDPSEPTVPSEPSVPTEPTEPSAPQGTEPKPTEPVTTPGENDKDGVPVLLVFMIACVCLAAGLGVGFVIGRKN